MTQRMCTVRTMGRSRNPFSDTGRPKRMLVDRVPWIATVFDHVRGLEHKRQESLHFELAGPRLRAVVRGFGKAGFPEQCHCCGRCAIDCQSVPTKARGKDPWIQWNVTGHGEPDKFNDEGLGKEKLGCRFSLDLRSALCNSWQTVHVLDTSRLQCK